MALNTQNIDLRFVQGTDTKTDEKNVQFLNFQNLENYRVTKVGEITPRGGWNTYKTISNPNSTPAFECVADETQVVSGVANFIRAVTPTASIDLAPALRGILARSYFGKVDDCRMSIAASTDLVCMVWADTSNSTTTGTFLGILILEAATGRTVYQAITTVNIPTGAMLQVVCVNSQFVIFYSDGSCDMKARLVDTGSPLNPTGLLTWASSPTATTSMRFSVVSDGTNVLLAYAADNSATVSLQRLTLSGSTLTVASSGSAFTLGGPARCIGTSLNTSGGASFGVVAGADGIHYKGILKTPTLTTIGTEQTLTVGANEAFRAVRHNPAAQGASFGSEGIFWVFDTVTLQGAGYCNSINSSGFTGLTIMRGGLRPLTGAYTESNRSFMVHDSYTTPTYGSQPIVTSPFDSDLSGVLGVGMNIGNYVSGEQQQCANPVTVGTKAFFTLPAVTAIDDFDSATPAAGTLSSTVQLTPRLQASLLTLDTSVSNVGGIEAGNGQRLYIGNALTNTYTGVFPGALPEVMIQATDCSLVAGGSESAGVFSFCFAKVHIGAQGNEYRTYSEIFTANANANQRLQYTLRAWEVDSASGTSSVELYRTERNGTVFYKTREDVAPGTILDSATDADLVEGRYADINGNELPPTLIPVSRFTGKFRDRLFIIPADYPNKILFEKPQLFPSGTVFAPGLELEVPEEGGPLVGAHQMDSALYMFKRNKILTSYGDPPGPTGEGGTLTLPQVTFGGVGAVDPRSIILTQKGLMFKSEKGFYIILRNQELAFVGQGPFDDRASAVTGSGVSSDDSEVYFLHANGSVWVYNLDINGWYKWTTPSGAGALAASNADIFVATTASVVQSSTNTTDPSTAVIPTDLTTGWLRLSGIRGFQRVKRLYLLGERLANCTLTIDVLVDYSTTPVQTETINVASLTGNPLQIDLHLSRQKCESIAFRIRSNQIGVSLSGATLEVGVKAGVDKSAGRSGNGA